MHAEETNYPHEALPQLVREVVEPFRRMTGMPPEAIGTLVMAACHGALGNLARIDMGNGWTEACASWTALVAPSGSMKTAAIGCAQCILQAVEEAERGDGGQDGWNRMLVVTGDPTTEAIAMAEAANPLGLVVCRDELSGIIAGMDGHRQGKGVDRGFYLQAYDGATYQQLRKKSESARIPHHLLTFIGCIQPDILRGAFSAADITSGFVPRWQFVRIPRREPGSEPPVDHGAEREFVRARGRLVERLLDLRAIGMAGKDPHVVRVSDEAQAALRGFRSGQDHRAWPLPDGPRRAMLLKSGGVAVRTALVIHMLESQGMGSRAEDIVVPVTSEQAERAARIARWHAGENERVYAGAFGKPLPAQEAERAREMAEQLHAERGAFTHRDYQRRHHIATAEEAKRLLGLCRSAGWNTHAAPARAGGGHQPMLWSPPES
ncbi:MAG: DUF3987 domain-containing protein [Chloroflexi bacterium]|nr:DUF3987 domain-containing protein [Chloroflexota bacterium]